MAKMTSLYLCNRMVQAVVGSCSGRRLRIDSFCQADLPEGCLINGVVTNEGALQTALQEFIRTNNLPAKNVGLVLNSNQVVTRLLTLPTMPEKKMRTVVTRELNTGSDLAQPLDDYMLINHDAKARTDTLLAVRMEKTLLDAMMNLATGAGLSVSCIDIALAGQIKMAMFLPVLRDKTFVQLMFDGDNLNLSLFENGQYIYSTRNRLFNTRGTPESTTEILQKISGIVQFNQSNKSEYTITDVYFSGAESAELSACTPGLTDMQLQASVFPDDPAHITVPAGCTLAEMMFTAGNIINR